MADLALAHDDLRPLMFSIAYRMLGSVADAEDVVQGALLHMQTRTPDDVRSLDAHATTVTTRLAIDELRSARRRRESYVGPWLPEPLVEAADTDPAWKFEQDETVSLAFLTVLETLSPVERAVFLLREVFAYDYAEIAGVVQKSEDSCRAALRRARQHLEDNRVRHDMSPESRDRLAERFFAAFREGDVAGLEAVLSDDVTFYSDGGGKAPAIRSPLVGSVPVARFVHGLSRQADVHGFRLELVSVNGQPGAVARSGDGLVLSVMSLVVGAGRVVAIHNQLNPDKLRHLGEVGDLAALLGSDGGVPPAT